MKTQLIIIVPGIGGSKIYCKCKGLHHRRRRLYPRRGWFFNSAIDKHMYECPNIETSILKTFWNFSIYDKFLKKLNGSPFNRVEIFSYDWRRDPVDIARDLLQFIKIFNCDQYAQIKIFGHSLGGLIIRIMFEYLNGMNELHVDPEKILVYQCGTPAYGSLNIHDYNYGFELEIGRAHV